MYQEWLAANPLIRVASAAGVLFVLLPQGIEDVRT